MTVKPTLARLAILLLLALESYSFWAFPHYPTQDGPSHLYNAVVAADYKSVDAYSEYYEIRRPAAGNLLAHWLLVVLVKIAEPPVAEKLLLTLYAIFLPLSFYYFLQPLTTTPGLFTLLAFLFLPNFFLHAGFWNFCLSIPLLLFALGAYQRGHLYWFASLVLLVYLAHAVTWMILAIAVVLHAVFSPTRKKLLLAFLPPLLLAVLYAAKTPAPLRFLNQSLLTRLRTLAPTFLVVGDQTTPNYVAFAAFALGLGALLLIALSRGKPRHAWILATSTILFILALLGPDMIGTVSLLRPRASLFAWLFVALWIAAQPWNPAAQKSVAAAVFFFALLSWPAQYRVDRAYAAVLVEIESARPSIRPNSTLIGVDLDIEPNELAARLDPLSHAVGVLAPLPFIDLRNYEASTPYFPVQYRSHPTALPGDTEKELAAGSPDYLLFYNHPNHAPHTEEIIYPNLLTRYNQIHESTSVRLYLRQ